MAKLLTAIMCGALVASLAFYNKDVAPGISLATKAIENGYSRIVAPVKTAEADNPALSDYQHQQQKKVDDEQNRVNQIKPDYEKRRCIKNYADNVAEVKSLAQAAGQDYIPTKTANEACSPSPSQQG